jgi:DUF1365 family protein
VTASAIYEGTVRHRRFGARRNEFKHGVALAYVDLDELPHLLGGRLLGRGAKLVRFHREDYLGDPSVPLADEVRRVVEERTGRRPAGPIRLLTHLRSFGHCFNPVSFYYCYDAAGERVLTVVAHVTNTPWGERHAYVMPVAGRRDHGTARVMRGRFQKRLHVSPLMGMDHVYDWRVSEPGERLSVHIESTRAGERVFDATLALRRREMNASEMSRVLARYPLLTLRLTGRIYTHALRLKLRGATYHPHPERGEGVRPT